MAKDLLYFFDKNPTSSITSGGVTYTNVYKRYELGEVQQGFNMSFSINGDKDSVHFTVVSYTYNQIEPYTILWHENTNTWWIVSKDDTKRYANEIGYMYVHEIECLGAIELLNARELTGCGFRANKYTVRQVYNRLIKLSNLEFTPRLMYISDIANNLVDYVKTFENYTLLSALREFMDGYNYSLKMEGVQYKQDSSSDYYLTNTIMYAYSKTGDGDTLDISSFNDIRESRSFGKDSFGTKVVSNTRNVVSTKISRFPAVGVTRLTSNDRFVSTNSGDNIPEASCVRLPENAFRVNKLTMVDSYFLVGIQKVGQGGVVSGGYEGTAYDLYGFEQFLLGLFNTAGTTWDNDLKTDLTNNIETIIKGFQKATSYEFYDGFRYDPIEDEFKKTLTMPSNAKLLKFRNPGGGYQERYIILTDKATRDTLKLTYQGIYWERGSNLIKGFEYFGTDNAQMKAIDDEYSILGTNIVYEVTINGNSYRVYTETTQDINPRTMGFIVEYIPMGDLKIEYENNRTTKDIKLYNQNGKLNGSVALSKLINSYKDEISNGNITKYGTYYNYSSVPKVGYIVNDNGTCYVISSVSIDFYQNESGYYMEGEFQMSPQVSVKSLNVNANSNIRDYGIPQEYNVDRVQVYKDVYYFTYETISSYDGHYQFLKEFVSGNFIDEETTQYICFIRCGGTYPEYSIGNENPTGTIPYVYFKLPVVRFDLKKEIIYKLNFHDNNIIGYDSQSVARAWSPTNLLYTQTDQVNTPVSYVTDEGEVDSFYLKFCNQDKTSEVYEDYGMLQQDETMSAALDNAVIIDEEIFDLATPGSILGGFEIVDNEYYKDAIEVPIFEYVCQVINSDIALVGENLFDTFTTYGYRCFYFYEYIDDDYVTESIAMDYAEEDVSLSGATLTMNHAVRLDFGNYRLNIDFYDNATSIAGAGITYNNAVAVTPNKNIGIYRIVYDAISHTQIKKELFMVLKKVPSANITVSNRVSVYIGRKK